MQIRLSTVINFGLAVGLLLLWSAVLLPEATLKPVERRYVLTTLTEYPEELHRFGTVLRVDEGLAKEIVASSAAWLRVDPDQPLNVTVVVDVVDAKLSLWDVHVYFKPRTACLGHITSACIARMRSTVPAIVLGSENVGHLMDVELEVPELTSVMIRVNNINVDEIMSFVYAMFIPGLVLGVPFCIAWLAYPLLKHRKEHREKETKKQPA